MPLSDLGRTLVIVGVLLAALGGVLLLTGQLPWLGRLPGDISFERGNVRFYAPIATMLLVSIILTIVLNLLVRR
jgi:hypothetical protein